MDKNVIKTMVRGVYGLQKLRIQHGNRIAMNFRAKLGFTNEVSEDKEKAKQQLDKVLATVLLSYKSLSKVTNTNLPKKLNNKTFIGNEVVSDFVEYTLINQYNTILTAEEQHFKDIEKVLDEYPIYTEFLKKIKGIGPAMAGVIISEFDIHKAEYPSSLHMYAGLDVAEDGKGRSKRKEHLIKVKYKAKDGTIKEKNSITYNPFLKSKLLGVLAPSFLKQGINKSPYAKIYYDYRNRLENRNLDEDEFPKGRKHKMAMRYMIKRFIIDLYKAWRALEGLPIAEEYSIAKLGKVHKVA